MTSPAPPAAAASHPDPPEARSHRLRPSLSFGRSRRRRTPTIRLGGRRGWRAGGRFILGFLRRVRVQWLAVQYKRYVKRLRAYYSQLVKDIIDGAATMEAVQMRLLAETYFAVSVAPTAGNYYR